MTTKKKLNIQILFAKSYSRNILNTFIAYTERKLKNNVVHSTSLRPSLKTLTYLRSPQKYKRAQKHHRLRVFKSVIKFKNLSLLQIIWIALNRPKGVILKLTFLNQKTKRG